VTPTQSTSATITHLLYDGQGGWIEAVYVPAPETGDGYRWRFKNGCDAVRWLRS